MATNPMDGYRDIHPWPYEWVSVRNWTLRGFPGVVCEFMDGIDVQYDDEDYDSWTYRNHWTFMEAEVDDRWEYVVDFYGPLGGTRWQMPKDVGDQLADYILDHLEGYVLCLIWWGRIYRPDYGWTTWDGTQGDFVDHIHVEIDPNGGPS